jgi:uncharacterized protein
MKIIDNSVIKGTTAKDFSFDLYLPDIEKFPSAKPLLIFAHGFKGFKDWGHWCRIAEAFAEKGFAFLKFNFSHNGTSPEKTSEFSDLEAFGNNNFSKELADINTVIDWAEANSTQYGLDKNNFSLIGHSRGGPIVILQAAKDLRISKLITWAAVHELDYAWQSTAFIEDWREKGVVYSKNARTGQQMPLYFQLYEDFMEHKTEYSVKNALKNFNKPMLIVHGTADPAVKLSSAEYLKKYAPHAYFKIIEGADHVFGGRHPFPENETLPSESMQLIESCISFLENY